MAAAAIQINGVTGSNDDLPINVPVQLSNDDAGGEVSYAWEIVDQPEGAAVALSNPAIENPTFTPTKEGTYLLRLTVNATLPTEEIGTAVVAVRHLFSDERVPAAGEILEADAVRGWATAVSRQLGRLNRSLVDANIVVATSGDALIGVGSIVNLRQAVATVMSGLPGQTTVAEALLAKADTPDTLGGTLGVVIGTPSGAAVVLNGLILVRTFGLVEMSETYVGVAQNAPVFVDDSGNPSIAPGTYRRIIGRVVEAAGGTTYRWVIDPTMHIAPRVTTAAEGITTNGSGTWARYGGVAAQPWLGWLTTDGAATGLLYPLKVYPGETLYALQATIVQVNAAGLIRARLMYGSDHSGGSGVEGADATSPASAAQLTWDLTFGAPLQLPFPVAPGRALWLYLTSTGAGGSARSIGNVTAHVHPSL